MLSRETIWRVIVAHYIVIEGSVLHALLGCIVTASDRLDVITKKLCTMLSIFNQSSQFNFDLA